MKGWKTVALGVLIADLSVFSSADMQAWFGANLPVVGGAVGTIIVILRALTTSPIFRKE